MILTSQKKIILAAATAILLVIIAFYWFSDSSSPTVRYKEATATLQKLDIKILATGVVQPQNRLEIKSPVGGRVDSILVREGDVVKKNQPLVLMSSDERAALLDAARGKSKEEYAQWLEYYKATPLIAPMNGTVILRNAEPGQSVGSSDALIVMSDRLTVKTQVDETDIAQISVRQKASIILDAYPGNDIKAVVDQIAFEAKTINNVTTYIVDVLPLNAPAFIRSGMTANVSFELQSRDNVLTVPAAAIKSLDGKSFVLMKSKKDSKIVDQDVELGATDGKNTEIRSGLQAGDIVLIKEFDPKSFKTNQGTGSPFSPMGGARKPKTGSNR